MPSGRSAFDTRSAANYPLLVCDLYGKRRWVSAYRNGGALRSVLQDDLDTCQPAIHDDAPTELQLKVRLYKQYRRSRRFTRTQLRTIFLWLVRGYTLHAIAALDGCSPQAVSARFKGTDGHGGILKRAEELRALWEIRHPARRRVSDWA